MTEPEIAVSITDSEFTLTELEQFIDTARGCNGMTHDALVTVKAASSKNEWTLTASTAYRGKQ